MSDMLPEDASERQLLLTGRMAQWALQGRARLDHLAEAEFKVFSQWGEDGIIEWLVQRIPEITPRFVEFGVENFCEANCRFLLQNRSWRGLVMDGSDKNIKEIQGSPLYWQHDLTASCEFVTAETIDAILSRQGFTGNLGILSIDIDGNDWWVWERISVVNPQIVICEMNGVFGDLHPITIPYNPLFQRTKAHPSGLYFGASVGALKLLAERRGYMFLGTSSSGVNAFFIRNDLAGHVAGHLSQARAFPSRHRDSRNEKKELTFIRGLDRAKAIADMPVVRVDTGETVRLGDLGPLYSPEWLAAMG
ncbi:MAG: hypothetical protein EPN26_12595 [Rhodospirillales bacterium]|nr:MAG: hypothetical protein EPN26_12595 [Rhodospirillales bacterium]